jgi:hypothetical protein
VVSYVTNYNQAGVKIGGVIRSDYTHPVNPGNVLGYNPTTTMFALYDANDPLRKILLNPDGTLSKTGTGLEWALNFDDTEGPVDTHWIIGSSYTGVPTDGDDVIFGDLGSDWMVGGTGRDTMWGGWGDDLANADDKLSTFTGPDTNPSWEDLVYGGAGRDVLIGNTAGDRLIDWNGEFNSYWMPYNPFGLPAVSRGMAPALEAFLLALSKSQGADPTLAAQYGGTADRNGEPFGETGMTRQGDAAQGDQNGGPRDPQGPVVNAKQDVRVSTGVQPLGSTTTAAPAAQTASLTTTSAVVTAAPASSVVDTATNDKKGQPTPPASGGTVVTAAPAATVDAAKDVTIQAAPPAPSGTVVTAAPAATTVDTAKNGGAQTAPQVSGAATTAAPNIVTTTITTTVPTTAVGIANIDKKIQTAPQAPVTTAAPDASADKKPKT